MFNLHRFGWCPWSVRSVLGKSSHLSRRTQWRSEPHGRSVPCSGTGGGGDSGACQPVCVFSSLPLLRQAEISQRSFAGGNLHQAPDPCPGCLVVTRRTSGYVSLLFSSSVGLFCNPMNCSPPGSSLYGTSQARILEWVAISSSRGSSQARDWNHISCISRRILYHWASPETSRYVDPLLILMTSPARMEKAMAPHSSTLAWKIPWTEEPDRLQSMGSLRVGHNWATSLSLFTFMHWRGKWQPTPVFLPGESQGRGSLVGCRLWGCTESDTTEAT